MQSAERLNALTSLRFFAAAMIVIGHADEVFAFTQISAFAPFNQGVSFFFLLSGFILTWNYPVLDNWSQRRSFWIARFARIWPLHVTTCLLWIALVFEFNRDQHFPGLEGVLKLTTNLLLLQAWVPIREWGLSFNGVAWSISVEIFFYAVFPFLIFLWKKRWHQLLFAQIAALIALILIASHTSIGQLELLYFNPMARVVEFSIGIGLACVVRQIRKADIQLTSSQWFLVELLAATIVMVSMLLASNPIGYRQIFGETASYQFQAAGLWPIWFLFIGTFALSAGPLNRLLSLRPMVFLGEISFALYLCHAIVIHYLEGYRPILQSKGAPAYALFWLGCIFLSALLFWAIERPMRNLILQRWSSEQKISSMAHCFGTKEIAALITLCAVTTGMFALKPSSITPLDNSHVANFRNLSDVMTRDLANVTFDGRYVIEALRVLDSGANDVKIEILVRAMVDLRARDKLALHIIDSGSNMIGNYDRLLDVGRKTLPAGTRWVHEVVVPRSVFSNGSSFGLAMYVDAARLYKATGALTEWGETRVIIPMVNTSYPPVRHF